MNSQAIQTTKQLRKCFSFCVFNLQSKRTRKMVKVRNSGCKHTLFRPVVLNLFPFEAHFQSQKKNTRPTKPLTQISSIIKCFFVSVTILSLSFFLTLVCLKNQFNCFFNNNESASVIDHLNFAKKNAALWHSLTNCRSICCRPTL